MGLGLSVTSPEEGKSITDTAARIATLMLQGSEAGIDYILNILDEDASWENAATYIGMLAATANISQWGIGEIIYFLRHRYSHVTVAVYSHERDASWPDDLFEFIKKRFGMNLTQSSTDESAVVDFLGWAVHKYAKFWLLVGKGEIRVWANTENETPSPEQWEDMISRTFAPLLASLTDKKVWALYSAVAAWPRSKRRDDLAWTIHWEARNLAAADLPNDIKGDERHEMAGDLADKKMLEWEQDGQRVTTGFVRKQITAKAQEKAGFAWRLPPICTLFVEDTATGESLPVIHIENPAFQTYMLFHTRLSTVTLPERADISVDGDHRIYMDGEAVGKFEATNMGNAAVDAAVSKLMKTLRWEVIT